MADSREAPQPYPADGFTISYVPLPRIWCTRAKGGWSVALTDLARHVVERTKADHLATSHTSDPIGSAGP